MTHTRPTIGIVDDDSIFAEVLGMLLDMEGYDAVSCTHGADALPFLTREQPDVAIVDVWLDQALTGWDLVQQLRQAAATRNLPIIVCSADTLFLARHARAFQQQGCILLRKPFATEDLLAHLAALGSSHPRAPEPETCAAPPTPTPGCQPPISGISMA